MYFRQSYNSFRGGDSENDNGNGNGNGNNVKALHFFKNSTNLDDHLLYWKTLVKDKIPLGVIVSESLINNKGLKAELVKQLTTYINSHGPIIDSSTIKFICLNRCFQFMYCLCK